MLLPGTTAVISEQEAATASEGRGAPEAMAEAIEQKNEWTSRRTFGSDAEGEGDAADASD